MLDGTMAINDARTVHADDDAYVTCQARAMQIDLTLPRSLTELIIQHSYTDRSL